MYSKYASFIFIIFKIVKKYLKTAKIQTTNITTRNRTEYRKLVHTDNESIKVL